MIPGGPIARSTFAALLILGWAAACTDDGTLRPAAWGGCAAPCQAFDQDCLLDRCGPYAVDADGDGTPMAEDCDDRDEGRRRGAPELCDGVDNDCDREVDEGCACVAGATRECGVSAGACAQGLQRCEAGVWGACEGLVLPAPESCDGAIDDDCDGAPDNGCECAAGASARCGIEEGSCEPGVQVCVEGRLSTCRGAVMPAEERCDNADNDCDGATDEGCVGSPGTELEFAL